MRTRDSLDGKTPQSPQKKRAGRANHRGRRGPLYALLVALGLAVLFALQAGGAPVALAHGADGAHASALQRPAHPAHALPIRTIPAANAILSAPPPQVKMWFSEALNPVDSRIIVVDPSNHEVDNHDSRVNTADSTEMDVGLQLLRPGTYVVVWRTQSAVDGHVTGGSFIFRIANADGSVPPIPATLPSGNVPGAAGFGASAQSVDAPTLLQALGDWLALLCALFWVGGTLWEVWTLPVRRAPDAITKLGAQLATRRFQRLAPYALAGALLADTLVALALTAEIAGAWGGLFNGQYWQATLFSGSSFGVYWWMRQATLAVALVIALLTERAARRATPPGAAPSAQAALAEAQAAAAEAPIPAWPAVALETLRQTPRLPLRLWRGWLDLTPLRQAEVALGLLLLFAFAMSGHAAATPPAERGYAVTVDLLHLIFSAIWLGGLLYISVVLIPAARGLPERVQAALLARGAPEFGAVAIVSAAALALTGSLNATVHLTSFAQFATTAYGRTLFVKIELFLIMVAISAFHAFWLRPRLTRSLARSSQARLATLREVAGVGAQHGAASAGAEGEAPLLAAEQQEAQDAGDDTIVSSDASASAYERAAQNGHSHGDSGDAASDETRHLRGQMQDWLRREAIVGVGVLLCVALLALFAGTLAPTQAAPVASAGAFKQTHTVSGYAITLQVNPAKFGQNTFTVTVADAHGAPAAGASVLLLASDLDMDMGSQSLQLQSAGATQPGVYSGQGELTMAGNWELTVKTLPPGGKAFVTTQFKLVVGS
jgi:putative copper export protein/methionine-rich copper-binding protein CopC